MIGNIIKCENKDCGIEFAKRTHNQIYHDDECCRLATNVKIKEKYHVKRAQKLGIKRSCEGCGNPLSRYNSDSTCNSCTQKSKTERNEAVTNMLVKVHWQN